MLIPSKEQKKKAILCCSTRISPIGIIMRVFFVGYCIHRLFNLVHYWSEVRHKMFTYHYYVASLTIDNERSEFNKIVGKIFKYLGFQPGKLCKQVW